MFGDERPELADQLRANVSRFSAYKAAYVRREIDGIRDDPNIPEGEKQQHTKAAVSQFSRWTDAEMTTATARARTAKQFSEFNDPDRLRLFPNLRWIPSRSAVPRAAHVPFYNRVWAKDDNFWTNHSPGTEWNCKCDIEETDDAVTDNKEVKPSEAPRGLEGNPASTGEVFTDNASYIKSAGEETEFSCRAAHLKLTAKLGKQLAKERSVTKDIEGNVYEFSFEDFVYRHDGKKEKAQICRHFARSMFGDENYWLKNEILLSPQRYLDNAVLIARADIDAHNTGAATVALKEATDKFFYFETKLANGKKVILHVGRYKALQMLYLYAASKELPEYVEKSR